MSDEYPISTFRASTYYLNHIAYLARMAIASHDNKALRELKEYGSAIPLRVGFFIDSINEYNSERQSVLKKAANFDPKKDHPYLKLIEVPDGFEEKLKDVYGKISDMVATDRKKPLVAIVQVDEIDEASAMLFELFSKNFRPKGKSV